MRRLLPDSLAAWGLLILIAGLIVVQIATLAVFLEGRVANARMMGLFHLAERVSSVSRAVAAERPELRQGLARTLSDPTLLVSVDSKPLATSTVPSDDELAEIEDMVGARLADSGIADIHVERRARDDVGGPGGSAEPDSEAGPVERNLSEIAELYARDDAYVAAIQLGDGSWLNYVIAIAPAPALLSARLIGLVGLTVALVLAGALWSLRRLTEPYRLIARAAERFGRDLNAVPLPETGPREVREAAHAFNLMRERLQRLVGDRNQMVAAISHDLRTPVTRLKLRADFVDDAEQRGRMLADLDEIETMTRSVLAYASETAKPEPRHRIDLISLLETLCDETPGAILTLPPDLPPRLPYLAQPVALRRLLANLLDNAVKYGGRACLSLSAAPGAIHIAVDDDGPGIPPGDFETVFRPFSRLEGSRSRETGGAGLGLTIARSVARAHGGDVVLSNRSEGGLRAELVLPTGSAAVAKSQRRGLDALLAPREPAPVTNGYKEGRS